MPGLSFLQGLYPQLINTDAGTSWLQVEFVRGLQKSEVLRP